VQGLREACVSYDPKVVKSKSVYVPVVFPVSVFLIIYCCFQV